MKIIVGLGNPGLKFKKTRHNVGFRAVDYIQKENNFPKFKLDKKSKAEISKGVINNQEILLAKPQTFMNNSGFSVKALIGNWKLEIGNLVVAHDDFDLPFGEVKLAENSGSGGHHGVASIIESLGTKNFRRLKIGIRPAIAQDGKGLGFTNLKAENFVLKKFTKSEEKDIPRILGECVLQIKAIIQP